MVRVDGLSWSSRVRSILVTTVLPVKKTCSCSYQWSKLNIFSFWRYKTEHWCRLYTRCHLTRDFHISGGLYQQLGQENHQKETVQIGFNGQSWSTKRKTAHLTPFWPSISECRPIFGNFRPFSFKMSISAWNLNFRSFLEFSLIITFLTLF